MMLNRLSLGAFALFLFLLLGSHASTSAGPFTWLRLPLPTAVSNFGWQIGPLALLPVVIVFAWLKQGQQQRGSRHKNGGTTGSRERASWSWGDTAVSLPIALFSVWLLFRLTLETAHIAAMLGVFWLVYLFLINHPSWHQKSLWLVLAAVLLLQTAVGVTQFLGQTELGLTWLGEPDLDLLVEGTSVASRDGQNWLRAYGLNSHPNQFGLVAMALCLLLWPYRRELQGWQRGFFWAGLAAGVVGLLVSLSRTAWLGLLLGGVVFWLQRRSSQRVALREYALPLALLSAGIMLFALVYGDVMAGRLLALDSPLESRSLWERQRDWSIAWGLLSRQPLLGIGAGQYLTWAQSLNPTASVVHNVPLLLGVELGLAGLGMWLLFWVLPLSRLRNTLRHRSGTAVWLALILFAMLHPEPLLYLPKGAALWALAAAQWSLS